MYILCKAFFISLYRLWGNLRLSFVLSALLRQPCKTRHNPQTKVAFFLGKDKWHPISFFSSVQGNRTAPMLVFVFKQMFSLFRCLVYTEMYIFILSASLVLGLTILSLYLCTSQESFCPSSVDGNSLSNPLFLPLDPPPPPQEHRILDSLSLKYFLHHLVT